VLAVTATIIQERFQLVAGWFAIAAYIVVLFTAIVFSFRPAWGRRVFWLGAGILLGAHALTGLLMALLFPTWLEALGSFLTVIVLADLLLTASALWRITVTPGRKSH
jgi:hypothetical protein